MKASVAFVVLLALFAMKLISVSASCKEAAVGIADGFISDLTGSSEHNASTPAKNGRLNYTAGSSWCASTNDRNPHLQVDLHTLYVICAVSTQGDSQRDHWVKNYTLHSSTDGTTWTDYREGGQAKSFSGNYNRNSTVKHILYKGIFTRYLRFVIGVSHNGACLRVEIFGVPRIRGNIALFKSTIQSSTQGASISSKAVDGVKNAKFNKCASTNTSTDPWWRVDLGREQPVAEVRILNRGDCCATRLDGAEIRVVIVHYRERFVKSQRGEKNGMRNISTTMKLVVSFGLKLGWHWMALDVTLVLLFFTTWFN